MYTYTPSPFPYVTAQQVHASQLRLFISLLINSSRGRSVGRLAWGPRQDEGHRRFLWPKNEQIVGKSFDRFSHSFIHGEIEKQAHILRHSTNIEEGLLEEEKLGWNDVRREDLRID